jgi:hypothetical protein
MCDNTLKAVSDKAISGIGASAAWPPERRYAIGFAHP